MLMVYAPPKGAGPKGRPYVHIQDVPTGKWARSLAQDPVTGRVYLPYAEYDSGPTGLPVLKPGSFRIVVIERTSGT